MSSTSSPSSPKQNIRESAASSPSSPSSRRNSYNGSSNSIISLKQRQQQQQQLASASSNKRNNNNNNFNSSSSSSNHSSIEEEITFISNNNNSSSSFFATFCSTRSCPPRKTKLYDKYTSTCPLRSDFYSQQYDHEEFAEEKSFNQVQRWCLAFSSTSGPNLAAINPSAEKNINSISDDRHEEMIISSKEAESTGRRSNKSSPLQRHDLSRQLQIDSNVQTNDEGEQLEMAQSEKRARSQPLFSARTQKQNFVCGLKALIRLAMQNELMWFDRNNNSNNKKFRNNNNNSNSNAASASTTSIRQNIKDGWKMLISCLDSALAEGGGGEPLQVQSVIAGFGCWARDIPSPALGRRPETLFEMHNRLGTSCNELKQEKQDVLNRTTFGGGDDEKKGGTHDNNNNFSTTEFVAECLMAFDRLHRSETGRPHDRRHLSQTELVWNANCGLLGLSLLSEEQEHDHVFLEKYLPFNQRQLLGRIQHHRQYISESFRLASPMDPNSRFVGFSREVRQYITLNRIREEQLRRLRAQQQQQQTQQFDAINKKQQVSTLPAKLSNNNNNNNNKTTPKFLKNAVLGKVVDSSSSDEDDDDKNILVKDDSSNNTTPTNPQTQQILQKQQNISSSSSPLQVSPSSLMSSEKGANKRNKKNDDSHPLAHDSSSDDDETVVTTTVAKKQSSNSNNNNNSNVNNYKKQSSSS